MKRRYIGVAIYLIGIIAIAYLGATLAAPKVAAYFNTSSTTIGYETELDGTPPAKILVTGEFGLDKKTFPGGHEMLDSDAYFNIFIGSSTRQKVHIRALAIYTNGTIADEYVHDSNFYSGSRTYVRLDTIDHHQDTWFVLIMTTDEKRYTMWHYRRGTPSGFEYTFQLLRSPEWTYYQESIATESPTAPDIPPETTISKNVVGGLHYEYEHGVTNPAYR